MFRIQLLLLSLCCALLTSCALEPAQSLGTSEAWTTRQTQLMGLWSWQVLGELGVQGINHGGSANYAWQQTGKNYDLELAGPLGTNATHIKGTPRNITLQTSDGHIYHAATPEALLQQQMGWRIPVTNLVYWIRGIPVPNMPAQTQFDPQHRLQQLTQQGWTIHYNRYTTIHGMDLPTSLTLTSAQAHVKIIVNHWTI